LLIVTQSFSGIALTMLSIGLAAGIFKPLIAGTVRAVTDKTNKSLGFGIFYQMVNVGASFGPIVAGKLRVISWSYAFYAAGIGIVLMLLITIFFYKEPEREIEGKTLGEKFKEMGEALLENRLKFTVFLILLGLFFWLPFWAFFNLCPLYVDSNLDTARLYMNVKSVIGETLTGVFSGPGEDGVTRILGETISHTGFVIMIFQFMISAFFERFKALPTFFFGLMVAAFAFAVIGYAFVAAPALVLLGVLLFAIGEMVASPRIQEYITWIAPKEKAGLYMGMNFLAVMIGGGLSGFYTYLYGVFDNMGQPDYVWYVLAAHTVVGIIIIFLFTKLWGEFKEQEA
jgi:dipeptide/tripeptide permease